MVRCSAIPPSIRPLGRICPSRYKQPGVLPFFHKRQPNFQKPVAMGFCVTVGGMDAAVEPPWMDSRRVTQNPMATGFPEDSRR
jgi:hypothetical protein